jgi:hypothetical protein
LNKEKIKMDKKKRAISRLSAVLLILLIGLAIAFGAIVVYYTKTIPAQWGVTTAYGLQLENATNNAVLTSLSFMVPAGSSQTFSLLLVNTGNRAENATQIMPANLANAYTFTTTFANNTIARGGSYAFTVTLTDNGMTSGTTYSGSFVYEVVSGFSVATAYDTMSASATQVAYSLDTANYFQYQSSAYNTTIPAVGAPVLFSFVTKNINSSYEIQGLTFTLDLYSGSTFVSNIETGFTQAYWENSTAYGTFGNGTHMTTTPLMPSKTITTYWEFPAPSPSGTYSVKITYTGHNAQLIPTPITWTITVSNANTNQLQVSNAAITGAAASGQSGTLTFTITMIGGWNDGAWFTLNCTILQTNQNLCYSNLHLVMGAVQQYSYTFTPTASGSLTMLITLSNVYTQ